MHIRFETRPTPLAPLLAITYVPHEETAAVARIQAALVLLGWTTSHTAASPRGTRHRLHLHRPGSGPDRSWTAAEYNTWLPQTRATLRTLGFPRVTSVPAPHTPDPLDEVETTLAPLPPPPQATRPLGPLPPAALTSPEPAADDGSPSAASNILDLQAARARIKRRFAPQVHHHAIPCAAA